MVVVLVEGRVVVVIGGRYDDDNIGVFNIRTIIAEATTTTKQQSSSSSI